MKGHDKSQFHKENFPFYLRRSTYVHIGLFLFAIFGGKIILEQQQQLRNANIQLIQAAVRVDVVEMPKYTLNELKNLSSGVAEAAPEVKKEDTSATTLAKEIEKKEIEKVAEHKNEVKQDPTPTFEEAKKQKHQDFLSKLKAIGRQEIKSEKIKNDGNKKATKGLYGEKLTDLKQLILAGNKLNKGTAMYGNENVGDMTAFQAYVSRLPDLVRPHWKLPSFLMDKKLNARIRVWLSANGEVLRAEVYQSSGDSEYDQRSVEAVKAASPFPKLSEEFGKRGLSGDILLGFPL